MSELKPCPFCGGKAVYVPTSICSGEIACVGECRIRTAKFWDDPMTATPDERKKWHEAAAEKWNRRCNHE